MNRTSGSQRVPLPAHPGEERASFTGIANRFATTTLGCKVNLFESEVIARTLQAGDWRQVDNREPADLYVINTCTVTREADRQARQIVRRLVRQNPRALVVVTGCYAQNDPQACARIPGVDLVLGNDRKLDLHQLLPELERGELPPVLVGTPGEDVALPPRMIDGMTGHTRAFVQVQQGCDQRCTFCVIHAARGRSRSFPPGLVRRQVERLVMNGHREIVLCGVDIGSYGEDRSTKGELPNLAGLVREICRVPGEFRIRLSSIDPAFITTELIDTLAGEEKVCPHFHLSLQSGNTLILKRMKRRYTAGEASERIGMLARALPGVVFGADIMAGFPTESAAAFADTLTMIDDLDIAFPHPFAYSDRPGTPAERIPDQVPHALRRERVHQLIAAGEAVRDRLYRARIASRASASVLVEAGGSRPGTETSGHSADYLPVVVEGGDYQPGDIAEVRYTAIDGARLIARPIADS